MDEERRLQQRDSRDLFPLLRQQVIELYGKFGSKERVAEALGINPVTIWRWEKLDPTFTEELREALQGIFNDSLDAEIIRRGKEGWLEPVWYKGEQVGTVRRFDSNLLMFRKKQLDPSYRDNATVNIDNRTQSIMIQLPARDQSLPALDPSIPGEVVREDDS